jgi:hypothetical protein
MEPLAFFSALSSQEISGAVSQEFVNYVSVGVTRYELHLCRQTQTTFSPAGLANDAFAILS